MLNYSEDGAERRAGAAFPLLAELDGMMAGLPADQAGLRLNHRAGLDHMFARGGPITALASAALGRSAFPVRALLFDKSVARNWALGWHQDRTIVVRHRVETHGFGPWTTKRGLVHVTPPFDLLSRMVTIRIHLDSVSAENAPLLIAPGSHRLGRVAERDVDAAVRRCGTYACLAERGDVWLYSTPILHASDAALVPRRRRVLQLDYAADALPGGLEWLGI